jgi:hypothetical protein
MKSDLFWLKDPKILIAKDRLIEFVPTPDMTLEERMNAIARLSIYLGVLLTIIYKKVNMIYITLCTLTILYIIYEHFPGLLSKQTGGAPPGLEHMVGKLQLPTAENPFMNVLLTDYTQNPNKKPAADVDNPHVKKEIERHFNDGLNREIDDIWQKENSQRQFYATPSTTIPNDRDGFMKWCYNTPYSCKDGNMSNCIYDQRTLAINEITTGPVGPVPVPPRS